MRITRYTRRLALAAIGTWAGGMACDVGGPDRYDGLAAAVRAERAAWLALDLSEYHLVIRRLCFCLDGGEPYRVHVRGDSLLSIRHAVTGEPPLDASPALFPPVPGLFAVIEDAIARDAAAIDVTFDSTLHYPASIAIDYDTMIADEELGFVVTELSEGPPP